MNVLNRKIIGDIAQEDYFALPGQSFSMIKNAGKPPIEPTESMRLGTNVHEYLLKPETYDHSNIAIVKPIALALKKSIGDVLIQYLKPEVAITAEFEYNGFLLPWKGRVDLLLQKRLVIDIKVGTYDIHKIKDYFEYPEQVSGYCAGGEARAGLICHYHTKKKEVTIVNVPVGFNWWHDKIVRYGIIL